MSDYKQRLLAKHFGLESYDAAPVVPPEEVVENTDIDSEFTATGAEVEMNEAAAEFIKEAAATDEAEEMIEALESIYSSVESLYQATGCIGPQTAEFVRKSVGYATGLESIGNYLVPSNEAFGDDAANSTVASLEGISNSIKLLMTKNKNRMATLFGSLNDYLTEAFKYFDRLRNKFVVLRDRAKYMNSVGDAETVKGKRRTNGPGVSGGIGGAAAGYAVGTKVSLAATIPFVALGIVGLPVAVAGFFIGTGIGIRTGWKTGAKIGTNIGKKHSGMGESYLYTGNLNYPKTSAEMIRMVKETNDTLSKNCFNHSGAEKVIAQMGKIGVQTEAGNYQAIYDILKKAIPSTINIKFTGDYKRSEWLMGGAAVVAADAPIEITAANINSVVKTMMPRVMLDSSILKSTGKKKMELPALSGSELVDLCDTAIMSIDKASSELRKLLDNRKKLTKMTNSEIDKLIASTENEDNAKVVGRALSNYTSALMKADFNAYTYLYASNKSLISYVKLCLKHAGA